MCEQRRWTANGVCKVNGVNLYYEINGSGPTVVQIGGAVNGHEGYALITPHMQEHFTVIDYDHRAMV